MNTVVLISLIATAIADKLDNNQLDLAAVLLTQLADTLATIAVERSIVADKCN